MFDPHAHVFGEPGILPAWFWQRMKETIAHHTGMTIAQIEQQVFSTFWDPDGEGFIKEMDSAGVDQAIVLALDWGLAGYQGEASYSPEKLNEKYYQIVKKHPKRLLFGVSVDPRRPNAVEIVQQGVKQYGAKLLKLYPPAGWSINDRLAYPVYEACGELGIPVIVHTGPSIGPMKAKYTLPHMIDEVASDLPEIKFLCAHSGFGWWRDYANVARFRQNVYLEIGAWSVFTGHHKRFCESLREMMDTAPGRVVWSSDYSGFKGTLAPYVQAVKAIAEKAPSYGLSFTQAELDGLTGGTAAEVLGLKKKK